jgi:hypothetical protein
MNQAGSPPQIYPHNVKRRTGAKYYPIINHTWSNRNGALTLNQLVAMPFIVGMPQVFSGLALMSVGTASSLGRIGVYYDNNGVPDGLVPNSDSGQISLAAAGLTDLAFGANLTLSGLVWVCYVPQSVTGSVSKYDAIQGSSLYVAASNAYSVGLSVGYSQTGITGDLPSSWGATLSDLPPTNFPVILAKTV